jgi:inhibitor of cysteine peptidase
MRRAPALVAGIVLLASCSNLPGTENPGFSPVLMREHDNGGQVAVASDQMLTVELNAQPSTGYTWTVAGIDSAVLALAGRELQTGLATGGGDRELLHFIGKRAAHTTLTLVYRRPWETPRSDDPVYSVDVDVAGASSGVYRPRVTLEMPAVTAMESIGAAMPPRYNVCDPGDGSFRRCTPIKDQGSCGACWAFATVGVFENLIYLADPSRIPDLSEQYLISCGGSGCAQGGIAAFAYFTDKYRSPPETSAGAVYETDFPYQGLDVPCGDQGHPHHELLGSSQMLSGYYAMQNSWVQVIKQAIQAYGPIFARVCTDSEFSAYRGGVFHGSSGGCSRENHDVVLVGWDDNNGDGFWYTRNSWGSRWGENGYMRIAYGANRIATEFTYAIHSPPGNQPPVANAGSDQAVTVGATVVLDGSASYDRDGTIVRYSWVQAEGTPVALANETTARPTFVAPAGYSDYPYRSSFWLTVTDNAGGSASAWVNVTVSHVNLPPVANAGDVRSGGCATSGPADAGIGLLLFAFGGWRFRRMSLGKTRSANKMASRSA